MTSTAPVLEAIAGTPRPVTTRPVAVEARDLWFSYSRNRPVLRGVDLRAERGAVTMILGASGCGKTTLLKLLRGLTPPQRGDVSVLGRPVRAAANGRLDPRIAYIPQQLGLVRGLSVLDNALMGALSRTGTLASLVKLWPDSTVEQARAILRTLGIEQKAREKAFALSGGERQRVAIARALMQEASVILADEFVSQLDPATTGEIMEVMRGVAATGVTLIMTTHELDLVSRFADRVVVLRAGMVMLDEAASGLPVDRLARAIKG